ncbi:probable transcription factor TFIIIB component B'' at C-terminar half [Coccomyxa sp. Obi]|nr:probable transcription factor TFIIIB component B'' at C-terminar half [Coccomyxa sp. Obi]
MNFDLSSLDKLSQTQKTAKTSKFAPTARARPKRAVKSTPTDVQDTETRGTDAQEPAASAHGGPVPAVVEAGTAAATMADTTVFKGPKSAAAPKASQTKVPPASSELPAASPRRPPTGYDIPSPSSGAAPPVAPASPGSPQRRFMPRASARKSKHPAESTEQATGASMMGHEMPGTSAGAPAGRAQLDLAVVPSQEPQTASETAAVSSQQGRKGRAKRKREQEPLVLDVSTMNLRSIIKVAYAKERVRLEEEKRKKEEEEAALQAAEGSAPVAVAPAAAPALAAPSAAGLAPRVEVVDGQMRIVEQSLSIQAQPEAGARLITVEDNPKLNNMTYAKRMNNDRWSAEETELFYKALRLFGSDFTLLERMFPGRERKALKHKLNREDRADHARVTAALHRGKGAASLDSYKEVVALLKQHTEDHENTGGMEGAVKEQQPDLAAALLGSSGDPEATESDDNAEELLALPASGPQSGKQKGKPVRTKASQRRSRLQPESNPAEGAVVNNGAPAHAADISPPTMPMAAPEVLADGDLMNGKSPSGPTRGRVRPQIPAGRRKRTAPPAEDAQDGGQGEAAGGDAASPGSRATKRRVLAAA